MHQETLTASCQAGCFSPSSQQLILVILNTTITRPSRALSPVPPPFQFPVPPASPATRIHSLALRVSQLGIGSRNAAIQTDPAPSVACESSTPSVYSFVLLSLLLLDIDPCETHYEGAGPGRYGPELRSRPTNTTHDPTTKESHEKKEPSLLKVLCFRTYGQDTTAVWL
ncbi:uncharacterized protein MYCFIDRAFT_208526 [Pseudocercospora fijiensis CIRAD86]|uniref:Uncharacterized protein n=1 Tax=Pseudocercospora fijiensis (strain CIRAD86) TaxID=383855 RepID=M2YRB0_PSEFD|nr:uncharacterized protein MYCFIDRAFT_208526 [Pseudocercospora fijiensis CIRAD86]EME80235.1 hypothetical protein MYCFIDRAFT_208526 [Pseudocercospora fijiensis CIRAD86]